MTLLGPWPFWGYDPFGANDDPFGANDDPFEAMTLLGLWPFWGYDRFVAMTLLGLMMTLLGLLTANKFEERMNQASILSMIFYLINIVILS